MRTTLDIDDDVLQAAKEIAENRQTTAGKVLSELARTALMPAKPYKGKHGLPVLRTRTDGRMNTMADVNRARDEE